MVEARAARGQGLGHRLLEGLGIVAQPRQIDAFRGCVHRFDLGVGLSEKALGVQGDLVEFGQGRIVVRNDGRGQSQDIHVEGDRPIQNVVFRRDPDAAVRRFLHVGRVLMVIADENHARFPGCGIQHLPLAIGAHIPVQDVDVFIGVHVL